MRIWIAIAIAIALSFADVPCAAGAADVDGAAGATLSVTGRAEIARAPDLATVSATIVTNNDSALRALSDNNRRFALLGTKLSATGIGANDIRSASIQSYFNPHPSGSVANAGGQLFGFVVTRYVQIDVAVLSAAGSVVDAATAAGVTQIEGVSYGFRDRRAVERAALAAAVSDANAQAQAIASAAHVRIVRILRIGDQTESRPLLPMTAPLAMARTAEAPVPTTIAPSDLNVAASIFVTYTIR